MPTQPLLPAPPRKLLGQVHVPKASGVEPGFVAFCLEASQDCVILGIKGNTVTVFR